MLITLPLFFCQCFVVYVQVMLFLYTFIIYPIVSVYFTLLMTELKLGMFEKIIVAVPSTFTERSKVIHS